MPIFDRLTTFEDPFPGDGPLNMAVDQSLVEHASGAPILRAYFWSVPFLSIGYFQRFAEIENPEKLPVVRRWTGGGTVPHIRDYTFSLIVPKEHPFAALTPAVTYCVIHRAVVAALGEIGLADLALSPLPPPDTPSRSCFASPVRDDVMRGDQKIVGGAQRRSRNGLLHQASIQAVDTPRSFLSKLASHMAASHASRESLTAPESERARHLQETRYATPEWLRRR